MTIRPQVKNLQQIEEVEVKLPTGKSVKIKKRAHERATLFDSNSISKLIEEIVRVKPGTYTLNRVPNKQPPSFFHIELTMNEEYLKLSEN
jgi:hypothetical protein